MPYSAADYCAKADECDLRAASADSDVLKNQFLVIARQWRKLAEHADRHAASDHVIVESRSVAKLDFLGRSAGTGAFPSAWRLLSLRAAPVGLRHWRYRTISLK
jgi:hypothetical protein